MRTLVSVLIGIPLVILVMALAVVNNQRVTVTFDPFSPEQPAWPFFSVSVPLYAVFFIGLMAGIVLGGLGTWVRQGRFRKAARENRREARRWHDEADRLRGEQQAAGAGPALPAPGRRAA